MRKLPCDTAAPGCTACAITTAGPPPLTCVTYPIFSCTYPCGSIGGIYTGSGWQCNDGIGRADDEYIGSGCDHNCKLETSFATYWNHPVTAGAFPSLVNDVFTEKCGDAHDFYYFECEDGNLVNGDGCDSTCKIEPFYECRGGSPMLVDVCYEICGDGLVFG
jgi:cysteine-rich repeat protein